jgi:hypothetical protein
VVRSNPRRDGGKQAGHRGDLGVSRKPSCRESRNVCGEPVVTTLVCFHSSHTGLRVHRAPGFPCALRLKEGARRWQNSDASCREKVESRLSVVIAGNSSAVIPGRRGPAPLRCHSGTRESSGPNPPLSFRGAPLRASPESHRRHSGARHLARARNP